MRNTLASRLLQMEGDCLVERFGTRENSAGYEMTVWHLATRPYQVDVTPKADYL